MKKCEDIIEMLSCYLDNELHENDRKQVVKHLEQCNKCKQELESLKNTIELLNSLDHIDLPDDYNDKLHIRLTEEAKKTNENKWLKRKKYIGFASTLVAGLLFFIFAINGNYFTSQMDKIKVAYLNDAELELIEDNSNKQIAHNKDININQQSANSHDAISESYSDKQYKENDTKYSSNLKKSLDSDSMNRVEPKISSKSMPDNSAIVASNYDNIENPNQKFNNINSYENINEASQANIALMDTYLADPRNYSRSTIDLENSNNNEIAISILVDNVPYVSSNLISTIKRLGGNIEEITLLNSIKNSTNTVERDFKINISSLQIEKTINNLKSYGIIVENTLRDPITSDNIKITLRLLEKEFFRSR